MFSPPRRKPETRSVSPPKEVRRSQSPCRSRLESYLRSLSKLQAHVRLETEIGRGNCSVVLRGKDRSGRPVAVKAISLKAAQAEGKDERRLWAEVQVMREVWHPNLARLRDAMASWEALPMVSAEPPFLCILMEYVHAEVLSKRIQEGPFATEVMERVVLQLASALARLHRSGIVHRDVWAGNILMDEHEKVTLLDFGCSERLKMPGNQKPNMPCMSPESNTGMPVDVGDDAWALGLLITEMATGQLVTERLQVSEHLPRAVLRSALEAVMEPLKRLTVQLLDSTAARRPKMADLVTSLRGISHERTLREVPQKDARRVRDRTEGARQTPLGFRGRLCSPLRRVESSPSRPSRPRRLQSTASEGKETLTRGDAAREAVSFKAGQSVLYCPREAGMQKATVLGRSANGKAWHIRLENGLACDVDDAEEWRLCLREPRLEMKVLAWAEAPTCKGKLSASSTVSSLATAITGSTEVTDSSPMPKMVSKCTVWTSASPMRQASSLRLAPGNPPGPLLRRHPFSGQRLLYTTRSGQRYPGVFTGFLPNRPGYRIFLDCGESKEVEEAEAWRLAF